MAAHSGAGVDARALIFERLFDASPDATIVVDKDGIIQFASAQCEALLGYHPEELLKQSIDMLVPAPFRQGHAQLRAGFLQQSQPRPMGAGRALSARRKDGTTLPIEVSLSPIKSDETPLVAAALRDVSDRLDAENRLREARDEAEQATRVKTRFLTAASHDLRQPLQSISAYASVLESKTSDTEQTELLGKIQNSISSMSELLNALLDVSQLDAGQIEPRETDFELDRIFSRLRDTYGTVATRKGLSLLITGDLFAVHTDPALLERILENFVTNAIKYTAQGHITVSTSRVDHKIQIDVADSGGGIPLNRHEEIFEEYVQLENPTRDSKKGLGIGLALVKRLADLLNLELSLKSAPGQGSVFSITVPQALNTQHDPEGPKSDGTPSSEKNTEIVVLFVEDNEAILDSITLLLGLQGFQVHPAPDGEAAAKLLKDGLEPSIIVSDFRLPKYTGVDVIISARADLERQVPAIIMTGDTSAKQIESANLPRCRVLHKPAEPGELADHIRQLVSSTD